MRFFIDQPISGGAEIVITDAGICHQLARVLRYTIGDTIIVLDGKGSEGRGSNTKYYKNAVTVKIGACGKEHKRVGVYGDAVSERTQKDKMEWVFEKCTEIGVARFVPVLSEHSVKQGVNFIRARKIAQEAAEQSRRGDNSRN